MNNLQQIIMMKKARYSKKDPTKALKKLEVKEERRESENKKRIAVNRDKVRSLNLKLYGSERHETIHSHRYHHQHNRSLKISYEKKSPFHHSPISSFREKNDVHQRQNSFAPGQIKYNRSMEKSPYFIGSGTLKKVNEGPKHKSIRLSSLDNKETRDTLPAVDLDCLPEARRLMEKGHNRKSILILKNFLRHHPNHPEAKLLASMNWLKLQNLPKALDSALSIKQSFPLYSYQLYLILCRCYTGTSEPDEYSITTALEQLDEGIKHFPSQIILIKEKAKLLIRVGRHQEVISFLANKNKPEVLLELVTSHYNLQNYEKVLQLINSPQYYKTNKKILNILAKTLIKVKKYEEVISILKTETNPNLLYFLAFSYYKTNQFYSSLLTLQSCICSSEDNTRVLKLMMLIHIKKRSFYDAQHVLERSKNLPHREGELKLAKEFIEGAFLLIKRDMVEGVQELKKVCTKLQKETKQDQMIMELKAIVIPFIAYGLFCLGQYKQCLDFYKEQKKKYGNIEIEGLEYNYLLCEGLIAHEEKMFEVSRSCFQKLIDLYPGKLEPHFYLAVNEIVKDAERKSDSLITAQEELGTCVRMVGRIQNNLTANLFYHKAVLHGFLGQWKQSIVCVDQAIERSEENYWKYFYLRGLLLAILHNFPEAVHELSIALNLAPSEPDPFLLRSRCFQIEGQGNSAFKDLQYYIVQLCDHPIIKSINMQVNFFLKTERSKMPFSPLSMNPLMKSLLTIKFSSRR